MLLVTRLDRLARSMIDLRGIVDRLNTKSAYPHDRGCPRVVVCAMLASGGEGGCAAFCVLDYHAGDAS